jgi:hypothetical protein
MRTRGQRKQEGNGNKRATETRGQRKQEGNGNKRAKKKPRKKTKQKIFLKVGTVAAGFEPAPAG